MANILIVDDDRSVTLSLAMLLKRQGHTCVKASDEASALTEVRASMKGTAKPIDLVIMDMNYTSQTTGCDGLELLQKLKVLIPNVPAILMTAWGSIPLAVEGIKLGAMDFITKPWDNRDLLRRVETALSLSAPAEPAASNDEPEGIIGESEALRSVLGMVHKVAATDAPVLITGENGTGKELIARALHRLSQRHKGPFVAVNLGGLPRTLFESEMFGHTKGAFTGADGERTGRFEAADTGTIFLDEIGDLDGACQVKILRVLQEHSFERLGETTPRHIDIRVVCATNVDLRKAVAEGRFREDLFYRINLINIHVPALRERREDIPLLVKHFAAPGSHFTPDGLAALSALPYPGNVRQLQNLVKRLCIVHGPEPITASHVREAAGEGADREDSKPVQVTALTLEGMERKAITDALSRFPGNLSQAAAALGITRQSLYRRMEKLGIHQP